ncbi:membrane protein [Christiangramia portivictoriae]|uniref:membrane protein n=1 Tax=Christiangramia portivictoriae TaxID=326069 RepID=UPI000479176B|nr:membrane protein [Christiangramia portivictoriae]
MKETTNKYLIAALIIGVVFHCSTIFFTLENTYDALIHLFFAEHYANNWFEPWNYKWYTGFTVMGYPPLVHQAIGLFSYVGGLKFGMFLVAIIGVILFITGIYRFALLMTGHRKVAGYAALLAVFSSSFVETLHIFGQLPSIIGVSILMHSLPEIYLYIKTGRRKYFLRALSLLAVTVTSHHVTPIFGMVFFIFPLIGMVIMDVSKEKVGAFKEITFKVFLDTFLKLFWRIVTFGMSSLAAIIICILPYWINTKKNPITQVPIPHGSRDNFIEVTSSGLVFFVIPWGIIFFLFPYIFYRYYSKRYLFFGLSFTILFILGTGGTTPIPRMVLGDTAFNILTLDRFTLWGSIMALPVFGEFAYRFSEGDLKALIQQKFGAVYHRVIGAFLVGLFLFISVFTLSLGYFRPMQPQSIKMLPIVNFLNQDQHDHWRFLTLGFGDQMAWLSAQTRALTVDGNYHSARRLPELTTRAVERLENSKFRGVEGIGSLQQFLAVPEKYNLKYIFSNDKFYDPLLYFSGWQRLQQLENGIMVWEKLNIPPLSKIIGYEDVPKFLKLMWGIIPILTVLIAIFINLQLIWFHTIKTGNPGKPDFLNFKISYKRFRPAVLHLNQVYALVLSVVILVSLYYIYLDNQDQYSERNVVQAYYDAIDFKEFERVHSYLDPAGNKTIAQFMLEVAVSDGILSSYAKLDSIHVDVNRINDSTAVANAFTSWVTPIDIIEQTEVHQLRKIDDRWFIAPKEQDKDLPPDQLFSENQTKFYNHGRRKISTQQTYHEDVLKQPVLEVLSAKLVRFKNRYAIVGEIQNVDHVPADVVIKGTLYDKSNVELASYNARQVLKHKLMPKEISSFRVDFEGIAWLAKDSKIPETFDPDQFTPLELDDIPVTFNLQCAGNVAITDLYKSTSINEMKLKNNMLKGSIFNYGVQEVTIPQMLISYYKNDQLMWVEHVYLENGIRVQRKQDFDLELKDISGLELIDDSMDNIFVNGLPNLDIARKVVPERVQSQQQLSNLNMNGSGFTSIKLEMNNYVGNPK